MTDKVYTANEFWFGDKFSDPATFAARVALEVVCRGSVTQKTAAPRGGPVSNQKSA